MKVLDESNDTVETKSIDTGFGNMKFFIPEVEEVLVPKKMLKKFGKQFKNHLKLFKEDIKHLKLGK